MLKKFLLTILTVGSLQATWLERKAEGWAWYDDKVDEEKESKEVAAQATPSDEVEVVKKRLQAKLNKAYLNPTMENVKEYIEEQQKWVNQSEKFAIAWTKLLLDHPELDETIIHPTSQYGIQLRHHMLEQKRRVKIETLAQTNGLFFFYEGTSKDSQAFADVVIAFSDKYGWDVLPISSDGVFLPDFPDSKMDNGIIETMQIKVFPSLYVIDPQKKLVTPISFGLTTLSDVESNIDTQYTEQTEE